MNGWVKDTFFWRAEGSSTSARWYKLSFLTTVYFAGAVVSAAVVDKPGPPLYVCRECCDAGKSLIPVKKHLIRVYGDRNLYVYLGKRSKSQQCFYAFLFAYWQSALQQRKGISLTFIHQHYWSKIQQNSFVLTPWVLVPLCHLWLWVPAPKRFFLSYFFVWIRTARCFR